MSKPEGHAEVTCKRERLLERNFTKTPLLELHFGKRSHWKGYPPSPLVLWNHRVSEKSQSNLWAATTCGQNLEPLGFTAKSLLDRGSRDSRLTRLSHWR